METFLNYGIGGAALIVLVFALKILVWVLKQTADERDKAAAERKVRDELFTKALKDMSEVSELRNQKIIVAFDGLKNVLDSTKK